MKKNVFLFTVIISLLSFLQACIGDDLSDCDFTDRDVQLFEEINFASIRGISETNTRTNISGDEWLANDAIGIYMLDDDESDIANNTASNKRYLAVPLSDASNTNFRAANVVEAIFYPDDITPLRFIAYYPYREEGRGAGQIADYIYPVNVGVQDNPAEIDLMYSDDARNHSMGDGTVNLTFSHCMAKLIINVRAKEGTNIKIGGMSGAVNGMSTTASLNLNDSSLTKLGSPATFNMLGVGKPDQSRYAGFDTTYQAIIIPHRTNRDMIQLYSSDQRQFTWKIPSITFERGKIYTYNLTLSDDMVLDFTGGITDWIPDFESGETVPHAPSGDSARYIFPNLIDTMDVAYIRAGLFVMGNAIESAGQSSSPASPHRVIISEGFHIGRTAVTNAQYAKFLNDREIVPNSGNAYDDISDLLPEATGYTLITNTSAMGLSWSGSQWEAGSGANHPAVNVSWYGARAYAIWAGGDLPTEAQWEYTARAAADTSIYYVDGTKTGINMASYAWYAPEVQTHPVRQKLPNAWGMYDMFGNVLEWTLDAVVAGSDYDATAASPTVDPCGMASGSSVVRAARGGCYSSSVDRMRISSRHVSTKFIPDYMGPDTGFRVVFK